MLTLEGSQWKIMWGNSLVGKQGIALVRVWLPRTSNFKSRSCVGIRVSTKRFGCGPKWCGMQLIFVIFAQQREFQLNGENSTGTWMIATTKSLPSTSTWLIVCQRGECVPGTSWDTLHPDHYNGLIPWTSSNYLNRVCVCTYLICLKHK